MIKQENERKSKPVIYILQTTLIKELKAMSLQATFIIA